jgi:hypothetical protein
MPKETQAMTDPTEWREVQGWAVAEIDKARDLLERPLDSTVTAHQRGRIEALRALLERADFRALPPVPPAAAIPLSGGPRRYS